MKQSEQTPMKPDTAPMKPRTPGTSAPVNINKKNARTFAALWAIFSGWFKRKPKAEKPRLISGRPSTLYWDLKHTRQSFMTKVKHYLKHHWKCAPSAACQHDSIDDARKEAA